MHGGPATCGGCRASRAVRASETDRAPDDAADTPVWLATLPEDGPTGGLPYERKLLDWVRINEDVQGLPSVRRRGTPSSDPVRRRQTGKIHE